ncbi:LOW QUALITY PROTEIN: kinesin-like protein KIN-7O [Haliotis rubra]|uniref:LOW QUALITY PROTEIN: kinesin-like protein KIN-7O n=1 Tax=Haliotis rubra TaxID=36100 RepID=UPI001EE4EEAD|nr:LOW QUALITY PROTEIN: kinesin-like protein KIN-7O [Haliotis rubra]
MGDNIKVAVRVRPLLQKEQSNGLNILWNVKDDKTITSNESSASDSYVFDSVYDHMDTTQELYGELCSPIIRNAAEGFHGTIFAYGQSGSGKTYTISGSKVQAGVIELGIDELFDIINKSTNKEFLLRISYMEIYTEKIYDLFDDIEKTLKIQEDTDHQISVVGLNEQIVNSKEQVMQWIVRGETRRKFAETKANDRSSRSHVILRIIIESRLKGDVDAVMVSHLNFVDLAGSEKAADNSGERFKEGCAINRSLFTLSQVISKLSEGDSSYIGYRDSKLTRILQNALGGNSNTLIICTIAPTSMDESHSTLRFASRAKTIKNKPRLNEVLSDSALLKKYADEIKKLQRVVDKLGMQEIQLEKVDLQKKLQEKEEMQHHQDELINKLRQMICVSGTNDDTRETKSKKLRRETWCGKKLKMSSSAFHNFKLPSSEPLLLPQSDLPQVGKPLSSRHFSFPALEEEEPSFLQLPPDDLTADDSLFISLDTTNKKSFITNSRRSGRRSEDQTHKKEIEDLKKENEELHEVNTQLGNQVLELESKNEKLETDLLTVKVKLDQVMNDLAMQSLELDKATTLAHHDISLRDLQEFHRLEKDELEEQIEALMKRKEDLEGQAIPADVQYVKQVEMELSRNYDKMMELSKSNKDMEKEIDKLKEELALLESSNSTPSDTTREPASPDNDESAVDVPEEPFKQEQNQMFTEHHRSRLMAVNQEPASPDNDERCSRAARLSEIHALDFERTRFDAHRNIVHMGLRWDFIAKNQLPGQPDTQFHIPALSTVLGPQNTQDLSFCPFDATLQATVEGLRKDKDDLEALVASKNGGKSSSVDQDDRLEKLDIQLTDLRMEKTEGEQKYEKEIEKLQKLIVEKDTELRALAVPSVKDITTKEGNTEALVNGFDDKTVNEELIKQLSDHKQEQEVVLTQNEELRKQLSDHKQEQEVVLVQNEELKKQLRDHKQEQEVVLVQKEELKKQLNDHKQEQEVVLLQIEELQKQLSDHKQEQEVVLVQNEELQKQLSDHKQEQEVVLVQNEELQKQLSDHKQEQEVVLVQNEELLKQLSDHKQEQEVVLVQNEEIKKQLSDHKQEQEVVLLQIEELQKQLSDHKQEQEVVLVQNEELKKQISDHKLEQELVLVQNEELQKQLSDHKQEQEVVLMQKEELQKQLNDHKQEQEVVLVQNEELIKQLDGAKLELEVILAEKITAEDKHKDMEKIIQEKIVLEDELDRKTEQLNNILPDNKFCDVSKKGSNFERSQKMSMSDVVIHSFDADFTVSNIDISMKMSDGPMSIADELSLASQSNAQSLSLADELTCASRQQIQPMSLANELNTVSEPGQTGHSVCGQNVTAVSVKDEELQTSFDVVDKVQCKTDIEEQFNIMTEEVKNIKQDKLDMAKNLQLKESEIRNLTQAVCKLERDLDEKQEELETFSDELLRRQDLITSTESGKGRECFDREFGSHTDEIIAEQKVTPHISDDVDSEEDEVTFSIKKISPKVSQSRNEDLEAIIKEKERLLEAAKLEHKEQEMKIQDLQKYMEVHTDNEGKTIKLECCPNGSVSEIEDLKCGKLELEQKLKDLQEKVQEKSQEDECRLDVFSSEDYPEGEQELEANIQEKQEQLEKTRQDLQTVQEEMKTVRNSLEAASALLEVKEKEVLKLVEQRNSDLEKIAKLQNETQEETEKNKENVDMKEREISDLKVALKNLKTYVEEKESQTGEKDVVIEELQAKLSAAVAMEEEVKELTLKLDQSELDVEAKTKQIDEMTKMITQGTTELEAYETEVETLKQRVVEVEEQMAKNEAEFDDIKEAGMAKIDSLTDESSELQYKVANLESCLQEKEHEIHDIHEQIDKIIQDKLQESQTEILAKEQEIKLLLDSVSSLEEVIKDKDHEIEGVLSEKIKLQEGGEEMLKLVQEKHELEEKLREKTVDMASLEDERSRIETELTHKTAELQVMVEYKNKQDVELEDKITEIESLSIEILKLEDAVVEKTQDLGILQEEKTCTDTILQDKSALLEDLGKKMDEFENLYQEKSDEVDQCRVCIETLEGTIHVLKEELQTATNRKSEEELGSELDVLRTNHQEKVEEISRLTAEIEKLKNCQMHISTQDGQVQKPDVSKKGSPKSSVC